MNNNLIRVAISGVTGRMGRQLVKVFVSSSLLLNTKNIVLTAAIARDNSKFIGVDVGKLIGSENIGISIQDSIKSIYKDFDILIDFSSSQASLKYLDCCYRYNKNMIIGTTGFTQDEIVYLKKAANRIGIVFSPNFSIGINVLLKLLEKSASVLGNISDIEIIEMHHRNKKDIPSGTACNMRQSIESVLNNSLYTQKVNDYFDLEKKCLENSNVSRIKIHSIRSGNIVGEHSAMFINSGECLEIIHRAYDRMIFAQGAIHAAIWLGKIKVGFFNMLHVLGLNDK